jgi:hypothetical protein
MIIMALKGKGKYYTRGNSGYIYVPYKIAIDSNFPFRNKESVIISVEDNKIIITKEVS